ncbi:hypothetical protein [Micavibrio aeruginosavorus]|uniref:hypothetical protein n=1 Tax=Micavibrio aeruginosavorus TaxID=349221 RepID=UPI0011D20390|nr:hypothetical protein [Micavibrio aeruginosavorus]
MTTAYSFEEGKGFVPYTRQDLYDDWTYHKLTANKAHLHIARSHESENVYPRKSFLGTPYFQRYPKSNDPNTRSSTGIQRDQALHKLHIAYSLDILKQSCTLKTISKFDENKKPLHQEMLREILNYQWHKEYRLHDEEIVPDIIGLRTSPLPNLKKHFQKGGKLNLSQHFRKTMPETNTKHNLDDAVLVEIINQSPPTSDKWEKLLKISMQYNALIIFNIITNQNPQNSKSYFRFDGNGGLICAFYILNGKLFKNGKEKYSHYNYKDFLYEVDRLQNSKGYNKKIPYNSDLLLK